MRRGYDRNPRTNLLIHIINSIVLLALGFVAYQACTPN